MNDLKDQVFDILTGDPTYLQLLGDPDSAPYRTFYIQPPEKPVLPEVIYRFGNATVSQEDIDYRIMRVSLNVTIWTRDTSYETIAERVIRLLNQTPGSDNYGIRVIVNIITEELYDEDLNAFGRTIIFQVFYRRKRL